MTSLERSVGGKRSGSRFPFAVGLGGVRDGGGGEGGSLGALCSPWISRLRPPPRPPPPPRPLPVPALQGAATEAQPLRGTGARSPVADLDGHPFLVRWCRGEPPPPPLPFSYRLPRRDAAVVAASSSCHLLQQQHLQMQRQREAGAEQGNRRGKAAQEEREQGEGHGHRMVAGFGPFQVRAKRARLLLEGENVKQQREAPHWKLENQKAGGGRGVGRPGEGEFPGNYRAFAGDGCFPFFRTMTRFGGVRGEVGEVADGDGEAGLPVEVGRGRVLSDTVQRDAVNSLACRPWETPSFPHTDSRCMSANTRIPSNVGSGNAAGSSQNVKNNQWFHRHGWGENSKLLDYYPPSPRPVGNGSSGSLQASGSAVGPRGAIDERSLQRLQDKHIKSSAQGAANEENAEDTATTSTFHVYKKMLNEERRKQVINSSYVMFETQGIKEFSALASTTVKGGTRGQVSSIGKSKTEKHYAHCEKDNHDVDCGLMLGALLREETYEVQKEKMIN